MAEPMTDEFIVAEVTRSWTEREAPTKLISGMLEEVIAHNLQRGYVLYSFSHSQVFIPARRLLEGHLVSAHQQETIIAVFRQLRAIRSSRERARLARKHCANGEHDYQSNPGLYDTDHPYCTRCGVAK